MADNDAQRRSRSYLLLFDEAYWHRIVNFDALIEEGMIRRPDLDLFDFAGTAEDIWQVLVRRGLKAHSPNGVQGK